MTDGFPLSILPFVGVLLFTSGPSKIAFLVMAVVVNTVNGMRWRRLHSYFSQKFLERFKAEFNSPSAIVFIISKPWISTLRVKSSLQQHSEKGECRMRFRGIAYGLLFVAPFWAFVIWRVM